MDGPRALILFTRSPEVEARKKGLPVAEGAALFSVLLRSWADTARDCGAQLFVSAPAGCISRIRAMNLDSHGVFLTQEDPEFGRRLEEAARATFDAGAATALLAGGDCPAPASAVLEGAYRALESGAPGVLGPAKDGGLYLIGLPPGALGLLRTIRPGDPGVFRNCFERILHDLGEPRILPVEADLDALSDVARLARRGAATPGWKSFRHLLRRIRPLVPASGESRAERVRSGFLAAVSQRGPPPSLVFLPS